MFLILRVTVSRLLLVCLCCEVLELTACSVLRVCLHVRASGSGAMVTTDAIMAAGRR